MQVTSQTKEKENSKAVSDSDKQDAGNKQSSKCIICGKKAEYCMRGLPKNAYCRKCAEAYFKFLNYLDKL